MSVSIKIRKNGGNFHIFSNEIEKFFAFVKENRILDLKNRKQNYSEK